MGQLALSHTRIARRLTQLFRLERRGRFARLPIETARRLVERRAALIRELQSIDWRRDPSPFAFDRVLFDRALRDLAAEVERSREVARQRHDDLLRDIRFHRAATTGLRGAASGRLLGRG